MSAQDVHGAVFERGSAVLLARLVDANGQTVDPAEVASIQYRVDSIDKANGTTPIPGHDGVALDPTGVLFASLQTDPSWTLDASGYNFRHAIDVSAHEAFPQANVAYQVRYEIQPVNGQRFVFRFHLRAI